MFLILQKLGNALKLQVGSATGAPNFYAADFRGTGSLSEFLVWGAQEVVGTSAGNYRKTNGTAVTNAILPPYPAYPTTDVLGNLLRQRFNSLNLTGTGFAEVAEVSGLDVVDFTIEAWVKFDYTDSGSSTNVIYVNGGVSTDVNTFALTTDENNKVKFIVGNVNVLSTTVFSNNNWVHIAGVRGSNALKLYINGTQEATGTSGAAVNNALDLLIGRDTQTNRFYKERISDVRLYCKALSAEEEITNNYLVGLPAHPSLVKLNADAFKSRVLADGGVFESYTCLETQLTTLNNIS